MAVQRHRNGPDRDAHQRQNLLDALKGKLLLWGDELAQQAPPRFQGQFSLAERQAGVGDGPHGLRCLAQLSDDSAVGWRADGLRLAALQHLAAIEQATAGDPTLCQEATVRYWRNVRLSYMARDLSLPPSFKDLSQTGSDRK